MWTGVSPFPAIPDSALDWFKEGGYLSALVLLMLNDNNEFLCFCSIIYIPPPQGFATSELPLVSRVLTFGTKTRPRMTVVHMKIPVLKSTANALIKFARKKVKMTVVASTMLVT